MKTCHYLGLALLTFAASGCAGSKTAKLAPPRGDVERQTVALPETAPPAVAPSVDLGPLDAPAPVYEEVQPTATVAVPVAVPSYVAASPGYTEAAPLPRGSMAPIYDDPVDSSQRATTLSTPYDIAARKAAYHPSQTRNAVAQPPLVRNAFTPAFGAKLAQAAEARINPRIRYVAKYVKIGYPWGDVPSDTGVCTDVVIRSYRALGIDLQRLVHEDMKRAFSAYPSQRIYGLRKADPNIDHRRVVNLEAFFERVGASVPVSSDPNSYRPGDVVTWRLSGNEPHTGIVIAERDPRTGNPLIVHNLGAGVKKEDILFLSPPVGHYRFAPDEQVRMAALVLQR